MRRIVHGPVLILTAAAASCGPGIADGGGAGTASGTGAASEGASDATTASEGTTKAMDSADADSGDGPPGDALDLLIIVDDGPTMAAEQQNVARAFLDIASRLQTATDPAGNPVQFDAHIMITSTSVAGGGCDRGAGGAPVTTACIDRLGDFAVGSLDESAACDAVCPIAVEPGASYLAFRGENSDLDPPAPLDLDGDGTPESTLARALSCLGPQGIAGCPYGSPLEAMRRALDSDAPWNGGSDPFLRPQVPLAIMIISDGVDCAGAATALGDEAYWESDPATGEPAPSKAACWNAGVSCTGPDASGSYFDCQPTAGPLVPTSEFVDFLEKLRGDKEVFMAGAVGIPPVTDHSVDPPFHPTGGGLDALTVRQWTDGDLTPVDVAAGVTVADKQFELGVGPGCTGVARDGDVIGQATPPIRVAEVCRALDLDHDGLSPAERVRCCLESICSRDYADALRCAFPIPPWMVD